jgi:superfamily II DNA or RNA helicase
MARLEAVMKGLYYPTPLRVVEMIADAVNVTLSGSTIVLDACAGQGEAVALLAKRWGMRSYGVELHHERAAIAKTMLDVALRGSYHQIHTKPETKGISVLFLNPPYDDGTDDAGVSLRQEVEFVRTLTELLPHNGLLIFIPPRKILKDERFREVIRSKYRDAQAWRFPDPEAAAFDQVVVIARRYCPEYQGGGYGYGGYGYGSVESFDGELPVLGDVRYKDGDEIKLPESTLESFKLKGRPPEEIAPSFELGAATGAYASVQWDAMTGSLRSTMAPLVAPRPGHQAMLLAAGQLNGLELDGCLVKGGSEKTTSTLEDGKSEIVRERIVSHLSVLSLATGELDTWRVDENESKTAEWFQKHGDALARGILENHAPSFDGDMSRYDFSGLSAPGVLPGRTKPELLPIQRETSAAIVHRWKKHKSVILSGEMGVGKTTIGIAACAVAKHKRVVVICPTHLVSKWIRECEAITGQKGVAVTAKKISEVDAFFQDEAPVEDEGILSMFREERPRARFLVLSKEMAKLGSRWEPAFHTRFRIVSREVTVRAATYYGSAVTEIVRNKVPSVECPACGAAQKLGSLFMGPDSFNNKLQRECSECEEPMWTSVPLNEQGTCRWPLARHINRRYARQFALVIDEAHQHAKAESDQARAVHMLSVAATKLIAMTGTLYGGRASSIFHLLYRIDSEFRRSYKHDESVKFAQHHGLFETVYDEKERTSTYGYRKGRSGGRLREIPGMSPAMIPILLPFTIFVKLRDLQLELPPYSEHVEIVDHDPAVEAEIRSLGEGVKTALKKNPQVLGQYLMACLGYPDRPDQEERIVAPETEDEPGGTLLGSARAFPDQFWPKDLRVAEICKEEKTEGRKSLVFFSQTHRRDARGRVRRALEAAGLKVVVLDSNVAPEKREQWLRDAVTKGFDVMLTNGRLVETGMDLLFAHTIIQYGTEYSIATLRQSIRRSWRLGQTKPVKVIFMAYTRTMQATAINLIARKMRAAEMVDGDEAGGLAQHDVGGNNFLVELAHEVLQNSAFEQSKRRATGRRARAALTL